MVRIYGRYPVIDGPKITFYRHPIYTFYFTALDGKETWTAYKFTKNVYDRCMPTHFKRICSAIDELPPDLDFEVSERSVQKDPDFRSAEMESQVSSACTVYSVPLQVALGAAAVVVGAAEIADGFV